MIMIGFVPLRYATKDKEVYKVINGKTYKLFFKPTAVA